MTIIRNNHIRLTHECTINKFVIIHILLNQSKTEIRILSNNITRAGQHLQKQISSRSRCLLSQNLLIFQNDFR